MDRRYHVLLNVNSGTVQAMGLTGETLKEMFDAQGIEVTIDADPDATLSHRIGEAFATEADTIVAAGGDGTVTAIAEALTGSNKTLAIMPLGTANLLAKDLHIPLDPEQWVAALPLMEPFNIDVCQVNDHMFLHKAVIGILPELAAGREHIRGEGPGALLAYLRYAVRRTNRAKRLALEITTETGDTRIERVHAIAVASNAYDEGFGRFFAKEQLDAGFLTLYVVKHLTLNDMARLSLRMLTGNWRHDEALKIESVQSVTIRAKKPRLQAMVDGEVMSLETPLHFSIRPRVLPVLAPVPHETPDQADEAAQAVRL